MRTPVALVILAAVAAGCSSGNGATPRTAASSASPTLASAAASSAASAAAPPSAAVTSEPATPSSAAATTSASVAPAAKNGVPRVETVGSFDSPVYVASAPGDPRLYVVERGGVVRIVDRGRTLEQPYLDISADVKAGGEQGLLSIAFSPQYAQDGRAFVYYTDDAGDSRVAEFTRGGSPDAVDPDSRRELLKVEQPFANHNGGLLLFDPSGMLLIGLGDGGSGGDPGNRGQDLGELLGKILRIDPRPDGDTPYRIPADNPFVGKDGVRPEIWAYGLRNPWRFSFDAAGNFFLADVGQNAAEEINAVEPATARGANYGWSVFEADRRFKEMEVTPGGALVAPALTYGHDGGRCSVTGGFVYAGSVARLRGRYLYADYCSGEVWAATVDGTKLSDPQKVLEVPSPGSFGIDAAGEMYIVSVEDGDVVRITA